MRLLALLLVAACNLGTHTMEDVAPEGDVREIIIDKRGSIETVDRSDGCDNIRYCWRFAPWRRMEDLAGNARWLVSALNHACLVDDAQFTLALTWEGRPVRCHWRSPR